MRSPHTQHGRRRPAVALIAALAVAVTATPALAADCPGANSEPGELGTTEATRVTLCLVNAERTQRGLGKLRANRKLAKAARRYAHSMVDRGFFAHVSPNGSTPLARIKATGYLRGASGWSIGENLAWGTGDLATPVSIVRSWMESPGHRENILNKGFREFGMGVALGAPDDSYDGDIGATYVNAFGSRGHS